MSETLASLRSLGRSRGGRAGACPGSAACVLVRLPTPGGGSRDLEEGGLGRRSRLRVIGWDAHEGVSQSNGGIVDAKATDILVANNDLRRKSAPAADRIARDC